MSRASIRSWPRRWPGPAVLGVTLLTGAVLLPAPALSEVSRSARGAVPQREVVVLNRSSRPINEIYASPGSADQWGADRLGDRMLESGASLRLRLGKTRECIFDIKVIYDDASREETRGVDLCHTRQVPFDGKAAATPPEAGGDLRRVTLLNHSTRPVKQVFISPAEANQWGEDRLGESSISAGDRREVTWRGNCNSDLRVVFENRAAEERRGINLCETPVISVEPGWTTADALPAPNAEMPVEIAVSNRSGHVVTELFLAPEGAAGPGQDVLGAGVLGDDLVVHLPFVRGEACRFNARVVFVGKSADTAINGLDLCTTKRIELAPP